MVEGDLYPGLCLLCGFERAVAGEAGNMAECGDATQQSSGFNTSQGQTGLAGGWSQLSLCLASCLDMMLLKIVERNEGEADERD